MPSLTWSGKVMARSVSVQTMASSCLPSALDICMPTVTPWKTMQSTSSILSTGMTAYFLYVHKTQGQRWRQHAPVKCRYTTRRLYSATTHKTSQISGSGGGEHEDDNLLGYCALMMEAVSTYETSVNFYETTQRNIPEGCHLHTHCHENLKSHFIINTYII
jgi:hypothetical protein